MTGMAKTCHNPAEFWATAAARTSAVTGVFVVVVLAVLAWDHANRLVNDPLDSDEFRNLKARLVDLKKQPPAEAVRQEMEKTVSDIRAEDLRLRQEYFRQRRFAARGAWLLLGGMAVFLVAGRTAATLRRRLPAPVGGEVTSDPEAAQSRAGRWAVAGVGILLAAGMLALNIGVQPDLPETWAAVPQDTPTEGEVGKTEPQPPPPAAADLPSREECLKNWPAFRGFTGSGISPDADAPTRWDVKTGEGIAWKSPVPLPGNSSPVVWNDRLFLTGASKESRKVFCYDKATGKLLWQQEVPGKTPPGLDPSEQTGFASPTPATDGRRVYVSFATGDFAAFDFAGKLAWSRNLGVPKNSFGHAASSRVYQRLLIVQFDQGTAREGLSRLLALDTATGKTTWEVKRPVPNSWSTPIIIEVKGQEQIVTCGDPWVIAYRPSDGRELWRASCLKQDVGPSPVFADGVVYVAVEYKGTSAVRPDGQGDVSKTHVLWLETEGAPDTCSPLVAGSYLFLLSTYGNQVACLDAKSGKKLWEAEADSSFMASPAMAGKYLYLFGLEGKAFVLEPGPGGAKTVFTTEMNDKFTASPAFQGGRIYVRGQKELFCIGKK